MLAARDPVVGLHFERLKDGLISWVALAWSHLPRVPPILLKNCPLSVGVAQMRRSR